MVEQAFEIYIDGASRGNPGPSAAGILVKNNDGKEIVRKGEFLGETTNNVAEYTALLRGLKYLIKSYGKESKNIPLIVNTDSDLLINQLTGNYRIKNKNLMNLVIEIWKLMKKFKSVKFNLIKREENKIADKLANKAMNLMEDVDELNTPIVV